MPTATGNTHFRLIYRIRRLPSTTYGRMGLGIKWNMPPQATRRKATSAVHIRMHTPTALALGMCQVDSKWQEIFPAIYRPTKIIILII